ncbi:MAG: hypothetical protein DYG98_12540 [Haliscomenobacteraceae bacterium CHB4]|nr:hypothetical protein [Haliscomenobacteraceae bacterium CHB4]
MRPQAQSSEIGLMKIGILPVKYQSGKEQDAANQVTNQLYDNFTNSKRAEIINREFFGDLQNEKFLTSEIDFVDGETLSKTKSKGAKFLLVGKVATCTVEEKKSTSTTGLSVSYECFLNVGLRLIDVETGVTAQSYTLQNEKKMLSDWNILDGDKSTPSEAIQAAVKKLDKDIKKFMDSYFPVEASVVKLKESSKDKAVLVLVGIGSDSGVQKKQKFLVKEKSLVEGEPYYELVGEVEIEEVNGKGISTAKVTKGGKEIFTKMSQPGTKLVITSKN